MKTVSKFFGLIALCAAAFASCQKEQVFEEDQLSDAVEEGGTRGGLKASSKRESFNKKLTFMTYNIAACTKYEENCPEGKYPKQIFDDIAGVIDYSSADYISLNEVDYCNTHRIYDSETNKYEVGGFDCIHNRDQLRFIKDRSKQTSWGQAYYGPTYYTKTGWGVNIRGNYGEVGNGILYPKTDTDDTGFTPKKGNLEEYKKHQDEFVYKNGETKIHMKRLPLENEKHYYGLIIVETEDCVFASVHLGLSKTAREEQAKEINKYFLSTGNGFVTSSKPVILCGDFNADQKEVMSIFKNKDNNNNLWTIISQQGTTFNGKEKKGIDHILLFKNKFFQNQCAATDDGYTFVSRIISENEINGLDKMSDHYPVVTTLYW